MKIEVFSRPDGLRAGVCSPVLRLRQGYYACTLLPPGVLSSSLVKQTIVFIQFSSHCHFTFFLFCQLVCQRFLFFKGRQIF